LTVLALATLGDSTKNRNNPIFCRIAQELSLVAVEGITALDFANVNIVLIMRPKRAEIFLLFSTTKIVEEVLYLSKEALH
jgi:hypothetical protein